MFLQALFLLLVFISISYLYILFGQRKKLWYGFIVFQLSIGILAIFKVFLSAPFLFFIVILGTVIWVLIYLKELPSVTLSVNFLIGIHVLRIPVEVVLFLLYEDGQIPQLMTFKGYNFDILIGISSLIMLGYIFLTKNNIPSKILVFWNLLGITLLIVIVLLSILSSPYLADVFSIAPANIAILKFPYCFLPTCVVPLVLLAHILAFKKIRYSF